MWTRGGAKHRIRGVVGPDPRLIVPATIQAKSPHVQLPYVRVVEPLGSDIGRTCPIHDPGLDCVALCVVLAEFDIAVIVRPTRRVVDPGTEVRVPSRVAR